MDKAKLIENIKSQLKSLISNEVKFAEIKAGDLMISSPDEELAVGSEVFTVDEAGNNVPLADGDYTLDSGETITVVAGKVEGIATATPEAEVVEAAKEEAPAEEPQKEGEPEEEAPGAPEEDAKPEEKVKELEARLAKCEAMLEEMVKNTNKMTQELSKLGELPATEAISVVPSEFKSVEDKKNGVGAVDIMSIRERARKNR